MSMPPSWRPPAWNVRTKLRRDRGTLLASDHVPTETYEAVAAQYGPDEIAALLSLIVVINAWNAIGVSTRAWEPGSYQP